MSHDDEIELSGGWQTTVTRRGDIVYRSPKPQSTTVLALLHHLERVEFPAAPRVVGEGFASDGREQLTFVAGESPHPHAWSDVAAFEIGRLVRALHDATASFVPPPNPVWKPWFARDLGGTAPVIGHGDLGPWNILATPDAMPVAFIDWDNAGPVDALWDLADACWLNAQLHDDDIADMNDLGSPADRARQLRLVIDGYGLDRSQRFGFVDKMIEVAIRSARDEAREHKVRPETPSPDERGFPTLWAVTWRAASAAWMLDHRSLLDHTILH